MLVWHAVPPRDPVLIPTQILQISAHLACPACQAQSHVHVAPEKHWHSQRRQRNAGSVLILWSYNVSFANAVPKGSLGFCAKHSPACHIKKWLPHQLPPQRRQARSLPLCSCCSQLLAVPSNQQM